MGLKLKLFLAALCVVVLPGALSLPVVKEDGLVPAPTLDVLTSTLRYPESGNTVVTELPEPVKLPALVIDPELNQGPVVHPENVREARWGYGGYNPWGYWGGGGWGGYGGGYGGRWGGWGGYGGIYG